MKRLTAMILLLCILLSGCNLLPWNRQEPVLFYYQRAEYMLGQADGAIVPEERDGAGHITDMDYLLRLYLAGPLSEELASPFPGDVQLTNIRTGKNIVTISLSGSPDALSESEKIIAYSCLTLTCLELFQIDSVMICWGEDIITMNRNNLTLSDDSTLIPE